MQFFCRDWVLRQFVVFVISGDAYLAGLCGLAFLILRGFWEAVFGELWILVSGIFRYYDFFASHMCKISSGFSGPGYGWTILSCNLTVLAVGIEVISVFGGRFFLKCWRFLCLRAYFWVVKMAEMVMKWGFWGILRECGSEAPAPVYPGQSGGIGLM